MKGRTMPLYISEANYGYSELDDQAKAGNDLEYALDELRSLVSAAYPDNSRDARIEDIRFEITSTKAAFAIYIAELELLMKNAG